MTTFRLEMRSSRAIRYSAGARALCETIGRQVAARANAELRGNTSKLGFVMDSRPGARRPLGRWRVSVTAVGIEARIHDARNNTLVRALHG